MQLSKPTSITSSRSHHVLEHTAASSLAMLIATPVFADATRATPDSASGDKSIRPFRIHIPQTALDDLRRRVAATRWPDKETVANDRRKARSSRRCRAGRVTGARLRLAQVRGASSTRCPQFMTTIDGHRHPLHPRRSKQPNALPMIITHGWPGHHRADRADRPADRPDRSSAETRRTRSTS